MKMIMKIVMQMITFVMAVGLDENGFIKSDGGGGGESVNIERGVG